MAVAPPKVAYVVDSLALTEEHLRWLQQLPDAPRQEQAEILGRLRAMAASSDRSVLYLAGMGFATLGSPDEAIRVFERACQLADPPVPIDVVNVAVGLLQVGEFARARNRLTSVASGAMPINETARRYIAEIDRAEQEWAREIQFAELRAAALREHLVAGTATIDERVQLARALVQLIANGRAIPDRAEPQQLLEQVHAESPENVEAMELLVGMYAATNDDARLQLLLDELEQVAPESRVLRELDDQRQEDLAAYTRSMQMRTSQLLQEASQGGPAGKAAVESLRSLVQRFPANESYRITLMMALSMNSDRVGAVAQAERILQLPGPTHARHFNIAQVLWFAGDHQRAEQQFIEAYRLAADAQEKRDVIERLEYLRGTADG